MMRVRTAVEPMIYVLHPSETFMVNEENLNV